MYLFTPYGKHLVLLPNEPGTKEVGWKLMPNQLNKDRNKIKEKDEIRTTQGNLILAQQAERRRRFQNIADGHKSAEELLEETR